MPEKDMAKGASIRFRSYEETIPKLLKLFRFDSEIKKHNSIVLKIQISKEKEVSTPIEFIEAVLSFIVENKNPVTSVFIADGADGEDTEALFETEGFQELAEKYNIGLIDLNNTETTPVESPKFLKFHTIYYPKILLDSFVITLTKLEENSETTLNGALSSMLGAFPAKHYQGFFSSNKNKIRKFLMKYSIHDILKCKTPDFSIVDASEFNSILAGLPFDVDKQSSKLMDIPWKEIPYLKLLEETNLKEEEQNKKKEQEDIDKIIYS